MIQKSLLSSECGMDMYFKREFEHRTGRYVKPIANAELLQFQGTRGLQHIAGAEQGKAISFFI